MKTSNPFDFDLSSSRPSRNAFDISHSSLFTSPAGMLLPIYREDVLAGDYIEMKVQNFTRTQPSVAPAFVNFDEKVDFYFVPYRLMWSMYDSWRLGTNLVPTSNMGNTYSKYAAVDGSGSVSPQLQSPKVLPTDVILPSLEYTSLLSCVFGIGGFGHQYYRQYDNFGYFSELGALRLFDLLGYGSINYDYSVLSEENSIFPDGAACKVYRGEDMYVDRPGIYGYAGAVTLPWLLYVRQLVDTGMVTKDGTSASIYGSSLEDVQQMIQDTPNLHHNINYSPSVRLFPILAYNCIYQYFYRNTDFEPFTPQNFNVDSFTTVEDGCHIKYCLSVDGAASDRCYSDSGDKDNYLNGNGPSFNALWVRQLFLTQYRNFRRDRYNSVKPINGFGFNALQLLPDYYNWVAQLWSQDVNSEDAIQRGDAVGNIGNKEFLGYQHSDNKNVRFSPAVGGAGGTLDVSWMGETGVSGVISANELRLLFATDAMTRAMVYSKKEYKDLMKSELGIDTRNILTPLYLGSHDNSIQLSDVAATVENDDTKLAQLAGKGIGGNSSFVFKHKFDEDGIILGIHSIVPRNNYDSSGIETCNFRVDRYDLPFPQTSSLGLQPITLDQYSLHAYCQDFGLSLMEQNGYSPASSNNQSPLYAAFGFESRFGEYKSRVNRIHGPFQIGRSLDFWTVCTNVPKEFVSPHQFVSEQSPASSGLLTADFFKCRPNITDEIFNTLYDGFAETDPFMCSFSFNVQRVSNLPVLGVPSVNDISF